VVERERNCARKARDGKPHRQRQGRRHMQRPRGAPAPGCARRSGRLVTGRGSFRCSLRQYLPIERLHSLFLQTDRVQFGLLELRDVSGDWSARSPALRRL
jgi:hypothetical protein